ncbi:MAG: threonylcarbamoyl-AMP synthase [Planctomycetales bacterium 71-10]|nr:MAG: threonylcarbamoyl-AMP synthase [Planctomycetales bacterium 71-10]
MIRTRVLLVDRDEPEPGPIAEAAAVLRRGGLVAFATETVYGLGAVATDADAVRGIFEAKGRPSTNPLIVHAADVDHARTFAARWDDRTDLLARRFWPGPLTLVVPRAAAIPDVVAAGGPTVGLRVPGPTVARRLIEGVGLPLAAPSANRSNHVSPTRAEHVLADLDGRVHLILDSGPATVGLESTVLDLTADPPRVLRPGPISPGVLANVLGMGVDHGPVAADSGHLASPGLLAVHYAPRTRAVRIPSPAHLADFDRPARFGLMAFEPIPDALRLKPVAASIEPDPAVAARDFYRALRDLDSRGLDLIIAVEPPEGPEWDALRDRLRRATTPHA